MAQEDLNQQNQDMTKEEKERLMYLEFVRVAVLEAVRGTTCVYEKAKDKSGPLKSGVESVEGAVKTVVGPVYEKFQDIPVEVLKYVDQKVSVTITELDRAVPHAIKLASAKAMSAAQLAPIVAQSFASEVHRAGVVDLASGYAKSVYTKYEPAAEQCAVSTWKKLNQLPLFPQVAQVMVPAMAYCSEKYNEGVGEAEKKGYRVSSYLPLVPTKKIAEIFQEEKAPTEPSS